MILRNFAIAVLALTGALVACGADVTPVGSESASAVTPKQPGGSSATNNDAGSPVANKDAGGSTAVDAGAPTTNPGTGAPSCTPSTALAGTYSLSFKNGEPFTVPQEHIAQIVVAPDTSGISSVTVESELAVAPAVDPTGFSFFAIEGGSLEVGVQPDGNVGTTDGEFGPNNTSFTWTLNVPLTVDNFYGNFGGVITRAAVTEPSPCQVVYEVTHVRDDFPANSATAPTSADLVVDTFRLDRP